MVSHGLQPESTDEAPQAGILRPVVVFGVIYVVVHLAAASFFHIPELQIRSLHLGLSLALLFLPFLALRKKSPHSWGFWADTAIAAVAAIACAHIFIAEPRLIEALFITAQPFEVVLALTLLAAVLEGARRTTGPILPILVLIAIAYTLLGNWVPGWWGHPGIQFSHFIEHLYLSPDAIWGRITGLSAGLIAVFIIFGSFLMVTGAADTFMKLSLYMTGRAAGGAAKVATVASAFFGMLNGAAVANVATTGNFTIPAMIRLGYRRPFAGAVEAVASSGGQITPPIMGTAAFVMAELLDVSYATIALAALLPALLFYLTVWFAIDVEAGKNNLKSFDESEIPKLKDALQWRGATTLIVTVTALLIGMGSGITVELAAVYAILVNIVLYLMLGKSAGETMRDRLRNLLLACEDAARSVATLVPLLVCAQIILALVGLTGIGIKLSELILSAGAGQGILAASMLTMVVGMVLGMGMPTTAAYLLAAAVCVPAMTTLGVPPLVAHFFVFYSALLSALTPPVCTAVYTASVITRSHWWPIAIESMKLAVMKFILPFFFIFRPALLLEGTTTDIIWSFLVASAAAFLFAIGAGGFYKRSIGWPLRIVLLAVALGTVAGNIWLDLIALGVLGTVLALEYRSHGKSAISEAVGS